MKPLRFVITLTAAFTLLMLSVPGAIAQDDTLRIEIVRANLRIPIAIPVLEAGGAFSEASRQITQIVRDDLRREEMFNLADDVVYSGIGRHSHMDIGAIPLRPLHRLQN